MTPQPILAPVRAIALVTRRNSEDDGVAHDLKLGHRPGIPLLPNLAIARGQRQPDRIGAPLRLEAKPAQKWCVKTEPESAISKADAAFIRGDKDD